MSALSGPAIQAVREQLGLTVELFAAALGVHKSSVYRWEAARRRRPHLRRQVRQVLQALIARDAAVLRDLGAQVCAVVETDPMAGMRILLGATADPSAVAPVPAVAPAATDSAAAV